MDLRRRDFCFGIGLGAGAVTALALRGGGVVPGPLSASQLLRPPGAGTERDFLADCVRCGLCVDACPYDTLRTAGFADAGVLAAGTPWFDARANPCRLCRDHDDLLCIAACPTKALRPTAIEDVDIGVAAIDRGLCLAYNGVTCRACWHACPFPDQALCYDELLRPVVDADKCIGCGLCEYACLTESSSIVVAPRAGGEEPA